MPQMPYLKVKTNRSILDGLVKSRKMPFPVTPAKAGIQCFKELMTDLDPGFRRGDDFLRNHQDCQQCNNVSPGITVKCCV